jgi:hypothetical protein
MFSLTQGSMLQRDSLQAVLQHPLIDHAGAWRDSRRPPRDSRRLGAATRMPLGIMLQPHDWLAAVGPASSWRPGRPVSSCMQK